VQEGLDAYAMSLPRRDYDVTSIRASTPMFLMARRIKATGIKMVLSGKARTRCLRISLFPQGPNAKEFHEKRPQARPSLQVDCLRANKTMAAWGIEVRVPFLDVSY